MGLKPGRPYCTRRRHDHLSVASTNLNPKNWERRPRNRGRSPPTDESRDPPCLHGPKATKTGDLRQRRREATRSDRPASRLGTSALILYGEWDILYLGRCWFCLESR
jgi:hypothetical protein